MSHTIKDEAGREYVLGGVIFDPATFTLANAHDAQRLRSQSPKMQRRSFKACAIIGGIVAAASAVAVVRAAADTKELI